MWHRIPHFVHIRSRNTKANTQMNISGGFTKYSKKYSYVIWATKLNNGRHYGYVTNCNHALAKRPACWTSPGSPPPPRGRHGTAVCVWRPSAPFRNFHRFGKDLPWSSDWKFGSSYIASSFSSGVILKRRNGWIAIVFGQASRIFRRPENP